MLDLLRTRCDQTAPNVELRLQTCQTDALSYLATPSTKTYDLVVTHFFLDCLTQPEVETLAVSTSHHLGPDAVWLISDFHVPQGIVRLPAEFLIRGLYLAFRVLTGLRTKRLPNHGSALSSAGFTCISRSHSLFGILTTELWKRLEKTCR